MSRPEQTKHVPVLLKETIEFLRPIPGGVYIDATFGGGGHSRALLEAEPTITILACDWDAATLEQYSSALTADFPGRVTALWTNFAKLSLHLKRLGIEQVDGIIADFGTSRFQIEAGAGFSWSRTTPLDMRMSPAHQQTTAAMIINQASTDELMYIIGTYGEERHAKEIALAIVEQRKRSPIMTTEDLTTVVEKIMPRYNREKIHPATRTFQAFRIVVNKELDNISALLTLARTTIRPGGRIVCISFHSLEDRIVKQEFSNNPATWNIVTPQIILPSAEEITQNPPSRSARLRAAARNS